MKTIKISLFVLLNVIILNNGLAQQKELTRKEHLESLNEHYFYLNNHLWDYVSHVANRESLTKLDKKRRATIKIFYDELQKINTIGGYKNDNLISDALISYSNNCQEILKTDYLNLTAFEEGTDTSVMKMEIYLKELKKINEKLNYVTQTYINIIKEYNSKYYSKEEYSIHKGVRHEDMENKISNILKTYVHFTPILIDFLTAKKLEEQLYDSFIAKDNEKIKLLSAAMLEHLNDSRYRIKNLPLYKDDTTLVFEFEKILNYHQKEMEEIIPQMMVFHQKQIDFANAKKTFEKRQSTEKLTADDYDAMDIKVLEINESNTKYNIVYNNYLEDRNLSMIHFKFVLNHFLSKHIVREH